MTLFYELSFCINMTRVGQIEDSNTSLTSESKSLSTPDKMTTAFSRYQTYLKSYYSNNPIARDDKLCIAPSREFISLALISKDEVRARKGEAYLKSTLHGGVDKILAEKTPLEIDHVLVPESRFVLVEGPPGIGKSTFCLELCRKWDTLESLKDYKIVLQLKLRDRCVQNASSLAEIFYHRDEGLCKSVVDEVYRCEGEGVLLILDGFDEVPASVVRDKNCLMMELIAGICLPRATCLVTSRPSVLHQKCFPLVYRHIEILGFTDECKLKYAENAFKSEPDNFTHFKSFIISNPVINSLMYIPINCAILTQVYKDIRENTELVPKTMTELYTILVQVLIRRHMIERGKWDEHSRVP